MWTLIIYLLISISNIAKVNDHSFRDSKHHAKQQYSFTAAYGLFLVCCLMLWLISQ